MSKGEGQHILIVDDDRRIRQLLASFLVQNGYRVTQAANANQARQYLQGLFFDAIVLDVMMPGENGIALAQSLRSAGDTTPVLMLSALGDAQDRINGLTVGGDDYLVKPFVPEELLLRIKNLLRRSGVAPAAVRKVQFGKFTFDLETGELSRDGERVHLTGREKEILRALAQSPGEAVARSRLQPGNGDDGARGIDVLVTRIRQKIETDPGAPRYLQTVRGLGYCLFAEPLP